MGRRTTLKPGRRKETSRPSLFFIIAMIVALALLAWAFVVMARRPLTPAPPKAALDGIGTAPGLGTKLHRI